MPSTSDPGQSRPSESNVLKTGVRAIPLTESLGNRIAILTHDRRAAYERARVHRRAGRLVPASLDQEMAENEFQLRQALDRYAEVTDR